MALSRMEHRFIKEDHDPSIKLQSHVNIESFVPHAPGEGEFPEMFFNQAQGAEHMAQGNSVSPAFLPESRVKVTNVRVFIEATQPLSKLGEYAEYILKQS